MEASIPIATWDLRFYRNGAEGTDDVSIKRAFGMLASRWAFQLEAGEQNGTLHYQCRLQLRTKARRSTLMNKFEEFGLKPNYLAVTSNAHKGDMFYVMKSETRQEGPWTDQDGEKPPVQFEQERQLFPFQRSFLKLIKRHADDRSVNFLYEKTGGKGRSYLVSKLAHDKIVYAPPAVFCTSAERMMQNLASQVLADREYERMYQKEVRRLKIPVIFVDLPRSATMKTVQELYFALESFKTGLLVDTRYKYTEVWISTPHIWVTSNKLPDPKMLSFDRWTFWQIDSTKELRSVLFQYGGVVHPNFEYKIYWLNEEAYDFEKHKAYLQKVGDDEYYPSPEGSWCPEDDYEIYHMFEPQLLARPKPKPKHKPRPEPMDEEEPEDDAWARDELKKEFGSQIDEDIEKILKDD